MALEYEEYATTAWPRLFRVALLLAGNHADAEDLAQQTMMQAYRKWESVRRVSAPDAYVRRILTNTFLNSRRPVRLQREVLSADAPEQGVAGDQPELRLALWPHVRALPPRQRAVVVLRYFEDLSEQDIADTLGCSTGTVKSTAHKALATLRAAVPHALLDGKEA